MSFWKRSMEYLGLGPDDAYDDYDDGLESEPPSRQRHRDDHSRSNSRSWPAEPDSGAVRTVPARPSFPSRDFESGRRSPAPRAATSRACRAARARRRRARLAAADRRAGDRATAALRSGAGAGRPLQGGQLRHPQPRVRRPGRDTAPRRLRQRCVLCTRRHDGEGGHGGLPAQAGSGSSPSLRRLRKLSSPMAISPHDIRARHFTTVKRGGYDQREVEAFRTAAAEALEQATQQATAMEARARAAVARLQELQQQQTASRRPAEAAAAPAAGGGAPPRRRRSAAPCCWHSAPPTPPSPTPRSEATDIIEAAKAESRKAGEAERVRVEGEVQALLARRDFLEVRRRPTRAVPRRPTRAHQRRRRRAQRRHQPRRQRSRHDAPAAAVGLRQRPHPARSPPLGRGRRQWPVRGRGRRRRADRAGRQQRGGEEHAEAPPLEDGEQRHSLFSADEPR